ncbi:tetratricopeptide repeat protein [Caballeronia sp. LZ065]|uniref:NfrA family protein n=1 Tax=Caballeronia sp. LZ065 TaxID=3038571 RepID=UPI00285BC0AC|nr:tetratricopeptide repeat protein [Caballeronia sp. LZ065]MDR5782865.1 tetratricopeptide repeat protein [Caballeronia sp. LZ065]
MTARFSRRLGIAAWAAATVCAPSAVFADANLPLPLSGASYRVAREAFAAYDQHRYADAVAGAREAIRQRPDVPELRLLLANALAARGRLKDAQRVLDDAVAQFGPTPALTARRRQIEILIASGGMGGVPGDLPAPALKAARAAYGAYGRKDYVVAASASREAVRLAPQVERLRVLLIDSLTASSDDAAAWAAAVDATARFGDSDGLRTRRRFIGDRLAPAESRAAYVAREKGDLDEAQRHAQQALVYAPGRADFRMQLIETMFARDDLAGVEAAADDAIARNPDDALAWALRGYARAARGADGDFARVLSLSVPSKDERQDRDARVARTIVADVRLAQGDAQSALDALPSARSKAADDTDAAIALRRHRAQALAQRGLTQTARVDPQARPTFECRADEFGASCDVYAHDPALAATRAARLAEQRGERGAAADNWRTAIAAVPDDPQPRIALIDDLVAVGRTREASDAARGVIDAQLLDTLTDVQAAFVAQRAGNNALALHYFALADRDGKLPASAQADAGYAALGMHRAGEGARYLEHAIDRSADGPADEALSAQALNDARAAHAEATRDWGFSAAVNYRGNGAQQGVAFSPVLGVSNNWQAGVEAYWRPFGSLGDRMFEVYARSYENFGVKGGGPSGASTWQAAFGARVKPFASANAIFAIEKILPLGSDVRSDWLARAAYSNGFGDARRLDVPSWWTGTVYGEAGHYIANHSTYATANARLGRSYRVDALSPRLTVFPHAVVGMDYDSTIDHSVPVGIGAGVSARWAFRGGRYDAPRSFVDVSVQYRFRVAGDDRAKGVFFGAVFSY